MSELFEQVPVDFICVAVLGALGLRRLVRMERFHELRVVILTGLLWALLVYLLLLAYQPSPYYCAPTPEVRCAYVCVL